jgi:hypothetical protein
VERRIVDLVIEVTEDDHTILATSEDLAWEAAKLASEAEGLDIGSDDFVEAFTQLKRRYGDCAISYGHLKYLSALTLRNLMDAGLAVQMPRDMCSCENHLASYFDNLAQLIFVNFAQVYAVATSGWYTNEDWDYLPANQKTVRFVVAATPFSDKESKDDDHDR